MSSIVLTSLINSLLLSLSSTQLSPLCDKSILDGHIIIDSSALVGHYLLLFINRTVTVVDITNDREPIVAFNTIEEYIKDCGKEISLRAPIEVSYAMDELKADTHLLIVTKNGNIRVLMNNYSPSTCSQWFPNNGMFDNILDTFMHNDNPADIMKVNGIITMHWFNSDRGRVQSGQLYLDMLSTKHRIALRSVQQNSRWIVTMNELEGQYITTGIVIPKSVQNSFIPTNTLILLASIYSVEVPLELDLWAPFKVKDFSSVICRTDPSRSTTTTTMSTPSTTTTERGVTTTVSAVETTIPAVGTSVTTTPKTVSTAKTPKPISTTTSQTNDTKEANLKNESDEWKLFLMIVLSIIVVSVLLGIIIPVVYFMNVKSEKRDKPITIKVMPSNKNSRLRQSVDLRSGSGTASSSTPSTVKTLTDPDVE